MFYSQEKEIPNFRMNVMSNPFIVNYQERLLSGKVLKALDKWSAGKRYNPTRLTPKEMNDIGLCYWYGYIVPLDYVKAVKWYKKAAALKYPTAEVNLYTCYSGATGVMRDIGEALVWLRKSAKHGDAKAQYILAERYNSGEDIRRNRRIANIWYQKAIDSAIAQEDLLTLNQLGVTLYYGNGRMDKDEDAAIQLFEKAATLKYPLSILWLIVIYKEKHDFWMGEYQNAPHKISEMNIS